MKRGFFFACILLLATACGKPKRMIVFSKGEATVEAGSIKANNGSVHEEKIVDLKTEHKTTLAISSPAGKVTVDLLGEGLFVVNAKNDTLLGSFQEYKDPKLATKLVTQEMLKNQIDSLTLLLEGKNVNATNRNFYLLPNQVAKISDNIQSMVVGPYHRIRSAETIDGKAPEVYRFYSIKEVREAIEKMKILSTPKKI